MSLRQFLMFGFLAALFSTAQAAELSVSVAANPALATQNEELTYTVTLLAVRSGDSAVINNTVLTYGLPPAFRLSSATSTKGACTTGSVVECTIGQLTTTPVTVTIKLIPLETGSVTSNIVVTGLRLDPDTGTPVSITSNIPLTTTVAKPLPVQIGFNTTQYTVGEDKAVATITVTRSGESDRAVAVDFRTVDGSASAGQDYTAASGTLSWAQGDLNPKTFTVDILDDKLVEQDETINLSLTNATNASLGAATAVLTIKDNESGGRVEFSTVNYRVFEADKQAIITVVRNGGGDGAIAVNFASTNGTARDGQDYRGVSGTLTWAAGDTTPKSFIVDIIADGVIEGEETVNLILSGSNEALLGQRNATLTIIDDISTDSAVDALTSVAKNPVQREMAETIGTLCQTGQAGADLQLRCRELIVNAGSDPNGVSNALQQIAPDELAAQGRLAMELSSRQARNIGTRLQALRSGVSGGLKLDDLKVDLKGIPLPSSLGMPATDPEFTGMLPPGLAHKYDLNSLGVFISGQIGLGDRETTSQEAGFEFDSMNLTGGVDYRFADNLVLGLGFGYGSTDSDFASGGGNMETESYAFSLYGSYYEPKEFYIDGIYSFGSNDYSLNRNLIYSVGGTAVNQTAMSNMGGDQMSFSLSGGWHYDYDGLIVTPTARLDMAKLKIDSFQESMSRPTSAGSGLGLQVDGQDVKSFNMGLGVLLSHEFEAGWGVVVPEFGLEFINEFDNDSRLISGRFLQDGSRQVFAISTDEPDTNYFNLSLGVSLQYAGGQSAYLNYQKIFGLGGMDLQSIMAGLRLEF